MGATKSNLQGGRRGSTNNKSRLAGFSGGQEQKNGSADWGSCDARWLAAVVVVATRQGMEIAFSLSRDGGAHSLKLYDFASGERVQLWFNGDADLQAEVQAVYEKLGGDLS